MDTYIANKIKSTVTNLFELLPTEEQQKLLNILENRMDSLSSPPLEKLSRKKLIFQMALEINRQTQSK